MLCRPCERFSPITLCRTVCPTLTAIIAVRDTPRGGGCFRVDCFPACIRRRGVLLDMWGTQLSNRTAILNIPINPWGRRRGWLLETHRLNKTPWWDRTRINKPPCTPVEGGRGGEEERIVCSYFCPFTWVTWPLIALIQTGLLSFAYLPNVVPSWTTGWWNVSKREKVSSNIPAPPHFQLLNAL